MKKLILLCLILSTSCSSNDSSTNVAIVGTWKPIAEVDVCSTGSIFTSNYSVCDQTSRLVFFENASFTFNSMSDGAGASSCEVQFYSEGTWSLNNNILVLVSSTNTDIIDFFELNANTLKLGFYDADPNDHCDGGNLPSHYYTEFIRL